jgi:hypothetical protein
MALAELTLQVPDIRMSEKCYDLSIIKLVLSNVILCVSKCYPTKINFVNSKSQLHPTWIYEAEYQAASDT